MKRWIWVMPFATLLACKPEGSGSAGGPSPSAEDPAATDAGGATDAGTDTSTSTDTNTKKEENSKTKDDPTNPTGIAVQGTVDRVMIATDPDAFEVNMYELGSDGARGSLLASASIDESGHFGGTIPAGTVGLEVAVVGKGGSLTETQGVRARKKVGDGPVSIGVSVVSEMAASRSDYLVEQGAAFGDAITQSDAETAAAVGITDFQASHGKLSDAALDGKSDSARISLFLAGLKSHSEERGIAPTDWVQAMVTDFKNGSLDGMDASFKAVEVEGTPLYSAREGYTDALRRQMKDVIKYNSAQTVSFDEIPVLNANSASTISVLDPEDRVAYKAPPPIAWSHYVEWVFPNGFAMQYGNLALAPCIGPIKIRRVNRFGQPLATGSALTLEFLEIQSNLGDTGDGGFFSASNCGSGDLTSISIAAETQDSASFYYRPKNYAPLTLGLSDTTSQGVDFAFAYLDAVEGGKPIAIFTHVAPVDNPANFPDVQYVGDALTPLARNTCHGAVAALFRASGMPAVYVENVTLTGISNTLVGAPAAPADNIQFYDSLSDCTGDNHSAPAATASTVTIPQGQSYVPLYFYIPASYTRSIGIAFVFSMNYSYASAFLQDFYSPSAAQYSAVQ